QTTLSLDWNNVDGATGYILERKNSSGNWQQIYSGTSSKFIDTGLTANTQYEYRVKAASDSGDSKYTTLTVRTTATTDSNGNTIVDTPVFLTTTTSDGCVILTWTKLGSDYEYILYKAGRVVVNNGSTSYTDTSPSGSGVEGYVLKSYYTLTAQTSAVSTTTVVYTTAKPLEITGYEVSADSKIKLFWDTEPGFYYYIYRSGKNISGTISNDSGQSASWTDNAPLATNDYMLYAVYSLDSNPSQQQITFSNIYSVKKPTQSAATAFDAFWADYNFNLVDEDVLNAFA
ncbi:MAG: fibronectin type III domain-containing protein, partial [Planctomycetaceae bacterium]|nr:fibronectin type III domain-containing protein [Planctomycetaceae bacterium]